MTKIKILILSFSWALITKAQDPHFTQFYSAPLTINPSYTGFFENGQLRAISNFRQQWISSVSPIYTTTFQIDSKVGYDDEHKPLSLGILFMNDNAMKGVFKSNYFTLSGSYRLNFDEPGYKKLGIGFSTSYGDRKINLGGIAFPEQYSGSSFDLSLPNNETVLNNLKPYISIGAGLLYSNNNKESGNFFDIGISAFHLNKPKQTVLNDATQQLPIRYSVQGNVQQYLNENVFINIMALYQNQANIKYLLGGFYISKYLNEENEDFLGVGLFGRTKDAISPYVLLELSNKRIGISYDINTNNIKNYPKPLQSFELSLQFKLNNQPTDY